MRPQSCANEHTPPARDSAGDETCRCFKIGSLFTIVLTCRWRAVPYAGELGERFGALPIGRRRIGRREQPVGLFSLDDRPQLKLIQVQSPDLDAYRVLAGGAS